MATLEGKKITLKSSDGDEFVVDEAVVMESQLIRHMIEDDCADGVIPLPNVTSENLSKIIHYCSKHAAVLDNNNEDLKVWDADFINVGTNTLYDLILAANYLEVKSLLDLICQTAANMLKGKTVEEMRTTFNIKNDFTPEEEKKIRSENQWAFD